MTTANKYLANFGGTDTIGGLINSSSDTYTRVSSVSDTLYANNDFGYSGNYEGKVRNVTMVQSGAKQFLVSWKYGYPGVSTVKMNPTVSSATYFSTQTPGDAGTSGGSQLYGFRILRGDSRGVYIDITQSVLGDSNYSSHDWDGAYSFTDTSVTGLVGDTFYYTVMWSNAYGYTNSGDTAYVLAMQNTLATPGDRGFETGAIGQAIRVFFIVEHMNEDVIFRDGSDVGRIYLTPYINGERRQDLRFPAETTRAVIRPNAV